MRQVSIRTIGLIRSTSLSDLACRWFTSLWMIQSVVDGWKHHLVPLGLLSLIEMCLFSQKPRLPFWHLDRELKCERECVCVCLHIFMCTHTPGSVCSHVGSVGLFSLLDTGWSVCPSAYLSFISAAIAVKHLISFLMVLQMCLVYFLSEGLEAVMSPVPETEQPGRALLIIWHWEGVSILSIHWYSLSWDKFHWN